MKTSAYSHGEAAGNVVVIARFPRMKRVPMPMSPELAHALLDGVVRGEYVSRLRIDAALRVTGDLPPEVSLPYVTTRRKANFGGRT